MAGPPLLRGIDTAAFAVALAVKLRSAGVPVGFSGVDDFVRALQAAPPTTRSRLYWTARITLVRDQRELPAFESVFAAVFADAVLSVDPNARRRPQGLPPARGEHRAASRPPSPGETGEGGLPWATLSQVVAEEDGGTAADLVVPQRLPGRLEALADIPFEHLSPAETDLLAAWLRSVAAAWPTRRTRRHNVDPTGRRIALRETIARCRRVGWEPIDLVRITPRRRPRRVVMLCDVSQSMQAQATAYLHLMRALALGSGAETFAFATRLTRLTPVLTHRSAEVAIDAASAKVDDRFGGTRIATNLQALLASHHGGRLRGAIVIVGSDGWDSDPPARLAAAMARVRRRAYRVIWVNPRAGAPGFEPRVATMAAALPYCDALLPGDTFRSLAAVVAEIARRADDLGPGRPRPPTMSGPISSTASRGSTAGTGRR